MPQMPQTEQERAEEQREKEREAAARRERDRERFPQQLYATLEESDDECYFLTYTTPDEADDGTLVGVYTLKELRVKSVKHDLT